MCLRAFFHGTWRFLDNNFQSMEESERRADEYQKYYCTHIIKSYIVGIAAAQFMVASRQEIGNDAH